jgi:squalene-associated FAD-dependent desaturase
VGAGWAGIACAIKLTQEKYKVTLIEATPTLGGRARTINHHGYTFDNGQHICIGAYTETLKLLQTIGVSETTSFTRLNLNLKLRGNNTDIDLALAKIFAPLNTGIGVCMSKGLILKEKLALTKMFLQLYKTGFTLTQDCSILTALQNLWQPTSLITNLWQPIALAIMSTPIEIASAKIFLQVLKDCFTGKAKNSNWLLPKQNLSQILPIPAYQYLTQNGVNIVLHQPIRELIYTGSKCVGVANSHGHWYADNIVLATPAFISAKLLATEKTQYIANNLAKIAYNSITTIYLIFTQPVNLPYPMMGLLDAPVQWLFAKKLASQPNILSAIITSYTEMPKYTPKELIDATMTQLHKHFPHLPKLATTKVIQEKRAAFFCTPEIQQLRPTNATNVDNLFLAGDHTQNNYPATIEGAIRSGVNCANLVRTRYI